MSRKDDYYNRAKQEGYRARSAYKLQQLDETAGLLGEGRTVVDLGAAPGGWLQVAAERVGERGTVVGVDRQRIDPLSDPDPTVEYVRGDMTDDSTKDEVREVVGGDAGERGGPVDVVLSDMAPNMTGEYDLDHARSVHLVRQAFEVATDLLSSGGDFAAKVFDGQDLDDLKADIEPEFEYVREVRPDASRDSSSELYLVAKHRLTAPVREGEVVEVTIEDIGEEGDGIAKVENFTLFVSGVEKGETLEVRVDDVKPRYAFAQPAE
ncbi:MULTISPECIES: 23S rRNA (uridine(2552)-2'-O)-methyltransferase [Haloarcula]|uniref:Ribosomal RNA large subunit methyltransferase E n=1 Tax=Haloarcula pellucida TaxID=1427151 RepID=A0A830GQJ2_9EURY|nr:MULTISPECIES: 23S rRNA (uridine(2552)-2'-O)-methyltransferase [Halomicroarcula]MBX0349537.1 TRAM domain-containing protein [Halomicroarcula pellucida]MDS0278876.1 23S rRNA (uridine(2552)-2'-O)-methyltransferase [Halomicroarcula sp. S1AR25-4]GGO02464.1 23S rRNA methyltransferase [Halomicroarcula pellucida]